MRQAIIVIHGIGEQRPLATLRQFLSAITDGPSRSKPDRLSESFELRRFALVETSSVPPTDVYELYWAHHVGGTRWPAALTWLCRLVFRRTSSLPPGLRPVHRALWAVTILGVAAPIYSAMAAFGSRGSGFGEFLRSAITYAPVAALLAQWAFGWFVLGYVGDAARYLTPLPGNIEARSRIRKEGVQLLRRLHLCKAYSRIVVVGHSLGSVIGYDILRHLWDELRLPSFEVFSAQPEAEAFEALIASVNNPPDGTSRAAAVEAFQQAQHRLWRELRALRAPWLVTDFITLGSPLAHAALLLEDPSTTFDRRKLERELPTCPPTSGKDETDETDETFYLETHTVGDSEPKQKRSFRIPHHGAVFCSTRWTNLYFPHRWLVLGDVVGGPLAEVLGRGIRDVAVRPSVGGLLPRTLASHVMYWRKKPGDEGDEDDKAARQQVDRVTKTKDAIAALRSALRLEAKKSKEPWPIP